MKSKKDFTPFIMLAPAFILVVCVIIYPIISAVLTSFQYYKLTDIANKHFVGLDNYINVWKDESFLAAFPNTARWVILTVFFQFVLGLSLALLLNRKMKGRGIFRSLSLIPWVTPGVVIALIWVWIYNGNFGVLNDILLRLGLIDDKIAWLSNKQTALNCQIVTMIWQGIPFFMVMLLASLQTVSADLYEAAIIDGTTAFQRFRYITWPHLLPTVLNTCMLRVIWVFNNVEVLYLMTQGGPGYNSMTISLNAYIKAQKSLNFGYGSTIAVYGTLMMILFMTVYTKITKRYKED